MSEQAQFPPGLQGSRNLPKQRASYTNCFENGQGTIIPRPGLDELQTTGLLARSQFEFNGALYQVFGNNLNIITNTTTGAFDFVDTIAGSANIESDINFVEAIIVVRGGALYTLDKDDVLVNISGNANIVPSVDVAVINGRAVYIPLDGGPAFFSDANAAGTVQPLSFVDAESLTDLNKAVINIGDVLYIFGTDSIEPFRDTGTTPVPYARIPGRRIDVGFIGGMVQLENSAVFIGRKRKQRSAIFLLVGGQTKEISNEPIANILATYLETELIDAVANYFVVRNYPIVTFTLPNHTIAFFVSSGEWSFFTTRSGDDINPWGEGIVSQFENEYFTAFNDKIGKLVDGLNKDYGVDGSIERIIDMSFRHPKAIQFVCQRVNLQMSQGFNSTVGTVGLEVSKNGIEYGPIDFIDLGNIGQYAMELVWNPPGGLGTFESVMWLRFTTSADIEFTADALFLDVN